MMELIQDDWNSLTSEEEIHIVRKYMNTARRYIMVFTRKRAESALFVRPIIRRCCMLEMQRNLKIRNPFN